MPAFCVQSLGDFKSPPEITRMGFLCSHFLTLKKRVVCENHVFYLFFFFHSEYPGCQLGRPVLHARKKLLAILKFAKTLTPITKLLVIQKVTDFIDPICKFAFTRFYNLNQVLGV